MAVKENLITKEGLARLEAELQEMVSVGRSQVADKIKRARETGGTENNAEYEDAKNYQAFVEGRILELEDMVNKATVIKSHKKCAKVILGCKVRLKNQDGKLENFVIVGRAEASPLEGRISNESPVGKALLGHKVGDTVKVETPAGLLQLKILEVA